MSGANGHVRITAKLVKTTDGFALWNSDPLERELKDVWALQDEIAGLITTGVSTSSSRS